MSPDFQALMREATQLTRGGNLAAAQAAIQAALGGAAAATPTPTSAPASTPAFNPAFAAAATAFRPSPGQTIDVLARLVDLPGITLPEVPLPGQHARRAGRSARPAAPAGAGMVAGHHAAAGLQCDYQLFVPTPVPAGAVPLVVMLHGCTQNPADFAAGTRMNELAQAQGFIVVYPAQSRNMNPQGCWNWFKHSHQRRGHGEPELLASLTRAVMKAHDIDAARVYVAGLSAGGAMAAVLGRCYPDLYAAVGVHSGLAAGAARDLPSALAAMNGAAAAPAGAADGKPVIVFHGDADHTVHPANASAVVAGSTAAPAASEPVAPTQAGQRRATRSLHRTPDGRVVAEHWTVHGSAHAWSGGSAAGSYTDPSGPDASAAMWRFFQEHPLESQSTARHGDRSGTVQ